MSPAKTKTEAPKSAPAYPENCAVTGNLSFPLWNEGDLEKLKAWRSEKGISPGKFEDRIGGLLFIKQNMVDKVQSYLLEETLPFAAAQYAYTKGSKGFDKDAIAHLKELIENEDWSENNLPIRELSKKDVENLKKTDGEDHEYVAKFQFAGSGGREIAKKALAREDEDDPKSNLEVVKLTDLDDIGDTTRLWWGARNFFRGAFNMNSNTREVQVGKKVEYIYGISAYANRLYLRTDMPMNWGGSDDSVVLEDDYED
jgi:hypothetical protein